MLSPYLASGQLTLLREFRPVKVDEQGDRILAVTVEHLQEKHRITLSAPYFIDATEEGDLLALSTCEHVTGFESQRETGEPAAPAEAQPQNIQAPTVCFAISYHEGEDHTIERPADYAFWRDYTPALKPAWPGKLLSWTYSNPITLAPRTLRFDPREDTGYPAQPLNLWLYRRIRRRAHFSGLTASAGQSVDAGITLVNWPRNDYWPGERNGKSALENAKQLSLSLLYWMQTEAPREDGKQGWKGLKPRHDQSGSEDGLAMHSYIRESRRLRAEFTVVQQHVATDLRPTKEAGKFPDSVGVGSYRIDLHPSTGGDNYTDVSSLPFQIPLGALIPRRIENLLAGAKNLGVTHITNGCYRLHPVEWNTGESAGMVAAEALKTGEPPRMIRKDPKRLAGLQSRLRAAGVETDWPRLTPR